MVRSWSDAARAAVAQYPWQNPQDRARAVEEAELVSFGVQVEVEDLPLAVRQWLRRQEAAAMAYVWRGERWQDLTEGFEKAILSQALAANNGQVAATARALATTCRIVAYKAHKYGLRAKHNLSRSSNKKG